MKYVLSNGAGRYHLLGGAPELWRRGVLARICTCGYLTGRLTRRIARLLPSLTRLVARDVDVPSSIIKSLWLSEIAYHVSQELAKRTGNRRLRDCAAAASLWTYQVQSARWLGRITRDSSAPQCLVVRTGYGGRAIEVAHRANWMVVCDHSIAHPDFLIANGVASSGRFWRLISEDIARADWLVVNSTFVGDTMVAAGCSADRILVVPMEVEPRFHAVSPDVIRQRRSILFAGNCERRKGIDILWDAVKALDADWSLTVVGGWDPELLPLRKEMDRDPRVTILGPLSKNDLAREMRAHEVFAFPTRAEGSARVVMEAMASGMAVVTTEQAGSVGTHEESVLLADAEPVSFAENLQRLIEDPALVGRLGARSAMIISQGYGPGTYGRRLAEALEVARSS